MQTPDASEPRADRSAAAGAPALDTLLRRSAEGDRAAFSAFYDATVPWVHGLASAMFRSADDAAEATTLTYLTAWEEASEAGLDLSEHDAASHRERQVFTWLEVLAHRVMTTLLRSDGLPEAGHGLLPDRAGPGSAGPAERPEDLDSRVDPAAFEAVRLAWLGGLTDRQVAARMGRPVAESRTLLRDGVRQVVEAHRALTRDAADRSPETSARPALATSVREDVEAGHALELADLSAVHALETAGHTAAVSAAQRRGGDLPRWRSRVDGARQAVAWAFRSVTAEPPSAVLDDVLRRLPAQDVGMDLIGEEAAPARPPKDRLRWLKITVMVLLAALVLGVGAWTVWSQFTRPGIVHRVDQSEDLFTTSENPARDGGTAQAFLSRDQNSGYVTVSGMPQLPDGQAYQVWLYPDDGTAPASLGTFDANGFGEPVTFRGLDRFAAVGITVEPSSGSEVPTTDTLVGVDLDPTAHTGPRYGGRPSTN